MKAITEKMPAAEYHKLPGLSATIANILLTKTPLHAWFAHPALNPDYAREEKPEFDYGTVAHRMLLEGSEAGLHIVEANDWRTKAAQEQREAAYAEGKTPLLARQVKKCREMVAAAKEAIAYSEVSDVFAVGSPEMTIQWRDKGIDCRSRLDWLTTDNALILDYKTTVNAHPEAFLRTVISTGYDVQEAFYRRAVRSLTGQEPRFVFLAQEKEPPFACSLIGLDPAMRDLADRKVEAAIDLWAQCVKENEWPGYSHRVAWLAPPAWYQMQAEESLEEMLDRGLAP